MKIGEVLYARSQKGYGFPSIDPYGTEVATEGDMVQIRSSNDVYYFSRASALALSAMIRAAALEIKRK